MECAVELCHKIDQEPGLEVFVPAEVTVAEGARVGGDVARGLGRRVFGPGLASPIRVFGLVGGVSGGGAGNVDSLGLVDRSEEEDVVVFG